MAGSNNGLLYAARKGWLLVPGSSFVGRPFTLIPCSGFSFRTSSRVLHCQCVKMPCNTITPQSVRKSFGSPIYVTTTMTTSEQVLVTVTNFGGSALLSLV